MSEESRPGGDGRPVGRAGRARQHAESAMRRAEKRRAQRGPATCPGGAARPLPGLFTETRSQRDRAGILWVRAADRSARACEQLASVHERLAKAGSGDVSEHCRRVTDYRAAAVAFREAAEWFREVAG